ncbi:MAG: autotransporter assembly complex protein TamA [Psychrobium sp.]
MAKQNALINVEITGVRNSIKTNIEAHLGTLPNTTAERSAFIFNSRNNIQQAMQSLGYYQSSISTKLSKNTKRPWQFKVNVTQGLPTIISSVSIIVNGEMRFNPVYINYSLSSKIKAHTQLNHGLYTKTKSQILGIALAEGYFDAKYSTAQILINRQQNKADIKLVLESGPRYKFGHVSFSGQTIDQHILQSLLPFQLHQPYSADKVAELNQSLSQTNYFRSIKVLPQIDNAKDGEVPIQVDLQNKPSHLIDLGLGADIGSSSERNVDPRIRLTWRTPQINRHGHSQETISEWSPDRPKLQTTYTIPLTHPINDQLKLQLGLLRDKYGVIQDLNDDGSYSSNGKIESELYLLGLGRQQKRSNDWIINYSIKSITEKYTQQDVKYSPRFNLLGLSFSKITRSDNSYDPKFGFRQSYQLDYSTPLLGSTVRLARLQAQLKWITTPFDRHRFVSRLNLGVNLVADDDITRVAPSLRYFAGGDQSIRGYGYQELGPYINYIDSKGGKHRQVVGGRYLAVGSIEYQYYVTPHWRLATFVDAGNAYDNNQFKPLISTGGGAHWISPIGPIKLDVGIGVNNPETESRKWRIHLTMGGEL